MDEPKNEPATPEPPKQIQPVLPVCPYCGLDPCVPDMIESTYGVLMAKIFVCSNPDCRKIFNIQIAGMRDPRVVNGGRPPGVTL